MPCRKPPTYIGNAVINFSNLKSRKRGTPKIRWTDNAAEDLTSGIVPENDKSNTSKRTLNMNL